MSLILNIDTSIEAASISLANNGEMIQFDSCDLQKEQASWLHTAIKKMMKESGHSVQDLNAIGVTIGPGSYTGLRIGLSAAKGLCYSLKIPLVAIGTLQLLAHAVREEAIDLICPMIDARRMEVFLAVYDQSIKEIIPPKAMVFSSQDSIGLPMDRPILFTGNGYSKVRGLLSSPSASFSKKIASAADMVSLSMLEYVKNNISDCTYVQPLYIKDFHFTKQ